eukprot:scaffold74753_cov74-Phaeocystis_antarctica.AAC.3
MSGKRYRFIKYGDLTNPPFARAFHPYQAISSHTYRADPDATIPGLHPRAAVSVSSKPNTAIRWTTQPCLHPGGG